MHVAAATPELGGYAMCYCKLGATSTTLASKKRACRITDWVPAQLLGRLSYTTLRTRRTPTSPATVFSPSRPIDPTDPETLDDVRARCALGSLSLSLLHETLV